jgi:long-subunit fatty acid transport protein
MICRRLCQFTIALGVLSVASARTVAAQTNEEIFQQFQWNFSSPGARANAMGQAFIGLADDATATITNPAGITALTRPQVYVELKSARLRVNRLAAADALTTLQTKEFGGTLNSVPFFDLAAPIGSRVAVAFTRHEFLNYQESFQIEQQRVTLPSGAGFAYYPVDASVDFGAVSYAGSAAVMVTKQLSVGVTVSASRLSASARSTRTGFPGSTVAAPGVIVNQSTIDSSDTASAASVGILFRPVEKFSVGFVYDRSPKFKILEDFRRGPSLVPFTTADPPFPRTVSINVPDRLGVGISVRPHSRLIVAADARRVKYSDMVKDLTLIVGFSDTETFSESDVTEAHVGGEWMAVTGPNAVFVRGGVLTNPAHQLRFATGSGDNLTDQVRFNALPQTNETKGTFGAGFTVGRRFQVDAGYVWRRDFVISAAGRF